MSRCLRPTAGRSISRESLVEKKGRGIDMESSLSLWHVLILLIGCLIFIVPYVKIIKKAGYSGWWAIVGFIPLVNLIMLWVFALARWPVEDRAAGMGAEKVF